MSLGKRDYTHTRAPKPPKKPKPKPKNQNNLKPFKFTPTQLA